VTNCECEDHEEEGVPAFPAWKFSLWDVAGIGAATAGNICGALYTGFGMLSREFAAAANRSRANSDARQQRLEHERAQSQIAAALQSRLFDGDPLPPEDLS
jgi:hypothetical protein